MGLVFNLTYHPAVLKKDLPQLPENIKPRIRDVLVDKLTTHPDIYGKPLRRSLKSLRTLRVGDYRIVFRIDKRTIRILGILHRSFIYEEMEKRKEK